MTTSDVAGFCPRCGAGHAPDARFCPTCGQPLAAAGVVGADGGPSVERAARATASVIQIVGGVVTILLLLALLGSLREMGILWQPVSDGIGELFDVIGRLFR